MPSLHESRGVSSIMSASSALSSMSKSLYAEGSALAKVMSGIPDYLSTGSALSSVAKSLCAEESALAKVMSGIPDYLSTGSALSSMSKSLYAEGSALAKVMSGIPDYLSTGSALSSVSKSLYEHLAFSALELAPETPSFRPSLKRVTSAPAIQTSSWLEDDVFLQVLRGLDSALPKLWLGALLASTSFNPDRVRHVATSLRELVMHVVRILAPDHIVVSRQIHRGEIENGRPTRAARLRFIFEAQGRLTTSTSPTEVSDFLRHLDVLSGHTHRLGDRLSDAEVGDLVSCTMEYLIQLLPHDGT